MAINKITLKKVVVGTPIKTVTAGSFGINNLGGVTTTGRTTGTLLAFNQTTENYEPVLITGDSNHFITFDSGGNPDTLQINFTNDSISGSLIPKLDSAFDLGSSTKKWKDLFLSGSTINLGDLTIKSTGGGIEVKDSDGNTLLQNIKYITVNGDTDILAYDSNTSTFTFNDSDIARTDEDETFHKNVTIAGNLTVSGTTTTVNTEEINLADNVIRLNSNATGVPSETAGIAIERGDSDNKFLLWDETNNFWTIVNEVFYTGGQVRSGQIVSDSGTITNLATTVHTANTITANNTTSANVTSTNLITGANANIDSATIGNLSITNMLASSGDSATFTNIANTQFTGSQATIDSATITNLNADSSDIRQLSTEFINFDSAFGDSATITNLANTQLTASQITVDSATINTLNVDSSDVRQISTEFVNFDSAFGDSATITNIATTQLTVANANIDSAHVTNLSAANFSMSSGDSATITNIANTQLTGSQATLDSATVTNLNVDSSDIRQLSTEFINFDSAFGDSATITNIASANINADQLFTDSATITNIANSNLTAKTITNTTLVGDSATIGGVAIGNNDIITSGKLYYANVFSNLSDLPDANSHHGMFAHVHATGGGYFAHGGAWHRLLDSSTTSIQRVRALLSDSATITNLSTSQITLSQVTADSATINTINADSSDIRQFSTEFINADSAFIDSATIGGIALGNNDLVTTGKLYYANVFSTEGDLPSASSHHGMFAHVHATGKGYFAHGGAWHQLLDKSSANDSATITNLASSQLTVDNATFDSSAHNTIHAGAVTIDSATIINLANTQFTSSQITSDSATINNLNVDSSDIRQVSTEFINFDSAFGDSATITNLANSVLTAKAITNTTLVGDSATITNIANSVLTAKAITGTSLNVDSATIGNIAITNAVISSGDSATFTNIANTQFTGSQATIDSADIGNLRVTGITNLDSTSATVIDFDNNILDSSPYQEGRVWYDKKFKSLAYYSDDSDVIHEVGLEEHQKVYNNSGATILKGKPLYFSGNYTAGDVDVPTVGLADATDENAYNAQGLAAADIPNGAYGYCIISGQLSGVDTSALTASTNFFVGLGPGLIQNASPLYPNYPMCLGWVVSSATDGILLVNQQNHSVNSFRVRTSAHVGSNLQVDGDLTVLGSTTSVSSADLTAGTPMFRLNEGNAIGEAGTTFSGTGLDDAFYSGFFTGTANQNYYVRIDGVGTGAGGVDTFEVAFAADSTFSSPVLTKQPITGSAQMIHSTDNISINFASTTGHDSGARWAGTAGPINVDTGFFSNRNTGSSGVGFTYVGIYYDVSDNKWKLIDEYDSNPSGAINEADASYSKGTLVLDTVEGNVTGNLTGTVLTANQPNITAVGTLTSLAVTNGLTADSGDIRQLSTDFINTDSAFMDSATITNLATSQITGTNATLDSATITNLATSQITLSQVDADSADIRILTGDSAVFSSAIQTPKIITPNFTFDSDRFAVGGMGILDFISSGNFRMGINKSANIGSEGVLSTHALAVKGDAYFLDRSAGFSIELIPDTNPVVFRANDRTGSAFAGIDFKVGNGNSALDQTVMKLNTTGMELKGDLSRTSGDMTFNMPANIVLDADGGSIKLSDGGTQFGELLNSSSDFLIDAKVQDKDIKFRGDDGGSVITALTLDMSEAGRATFNAGIMLPDNGKLTLGAGEDLQLYHDGNNSIITDAGTGELFIRGTNAVNIQSAIGNNYIKSTVNAGTKIYFNDAEKFETTSYGANITGTLTVGNLNVDSADIGLIAREKLSTGSPDALTYDSAAGQFALNANHVMALIKTVDSNGSGLNADTLEGQAGSHYRIDVYDNGGTLLN